MDDDEIRAVVQRLSRPHRSGGRVIERAAILAAGTGAEAILAWITEHGGVAETAATAHKDHGLHGARPVDGRGPGGSATPLRFVLPPDALG
jgi:hypothetical protein